MAFQASWRRLFLFCLLGQRRRGRRGDGGEHSTRQLDLLVEFAVDPRYPLFVSIFAFVRSRKELAEAREPEVVELAQTLGRILVARRLMQRRLVRTCDRELMLIDAVLGLRAVDAFLSAGQSKLDNFDAFDLPAHRVRLRHRLEETLRPATLRG